MNLERDLTEVIYAAERLALIKNNKVTFPELQQMFIFLVNSDYYKNNSGNHMLSLRKEDKLRRAYYCETRCAVSIPQGLFYYQILCHEIAHAITNDQYQKTSKHCKWFLTHYLNLLKICMDDEFYLYFSQHLKQNHSDDYLIEIYK